MDINVMDPAKESTCTTCTYAEDFSNYWTASLYFRSPENGTYKMVPQMTNFRSADGEQNPIGGGITVYYMTAFGSGQSGKTTSFKPGFRMLSGNASLRSKGTKGICHRCNGHGLGRFPCDKDPAELPLKPCPGGIRGTVVFPSCWDGKNLDSPDHQSHVAYTPDGEILANAQCPPTHPIRVPQVMFEMQWDTRTFNDPKYFAGGKQPFVYSFGDG